MSSFIWFSKYQLLISVGSRILPMGLDGHLVYLGITHLVFTFVADDIKIIELLEIVHTVGEGSRWRKSFSVSLANLVLIQV